MQFRAMGAEERRIVLRAAWLLPVSALVLRTAGIARTLNWVRSTSGRAASTPEPLERIRSVGRAVNVAAAHGPLRATCLTRSVLLAWLLRRRGIDAKVRVGVNLSSGQLSAHAWVECEGVPVNDRPDIAAEFAPFEEMAPLAAFRP